MSDKVMVVEAYSTIHDLIKLFLDYKISSAPVVDLNNKLVGIVTKTDVLGYFMDLDIEKSVKTALQDILDPSLARNADGIPSEKETMVEDIMAREPITAEEDTPIDILAKTMVENNIHRIIITKNGSVSGVVSTLDILYFVAGIEKHG